jgi:hypothetical protein
MATYKRARRYGIQSWYNAMKMIMTKKWKWSSIYPPDR